MTKRKLLDTLQDELMQHPSQELLDCQRAVNRITARTFQQFWKALDPEETVTWQDLTLRLERLSSQN
jgi:hypothetical protein